MLTSSRLPRNAGHGVIQRLLLLLYLLFMGYVAFNKFYERTNE